MDAKRVLAVLRKIVAVIHWTYDNGPKKKFGVSFVALLAFGALAGVTIAAAIVGPPKPPQIAICRDLPAPTSAQGSGPAPLPCPSTSPAGQR